MKINRKILFVILSIALVVLGTIFVLWSRAPECYPGKSGSITIGTPLNESSSLIFIAEDRHFFAQNGLQVIVLGYDFGALALNAMLKGEADIAVATEFPLVLKAFAKEKVRTIGSIGKFEFVYLIGRKDRGIEKISDLKGKRIATVRKTIAEFYLGRFLNLHGINLEEITFIDLHTSHQLVDAVINGKLDAVVTQAPYATLAQQRLVGNSVVWPVQNGQAMFSPMVCRNEWITDHPGWVVRLLKSLAQAEEYTMSHPLEAAAIIPKRLNLNDPHTKTFFLRNQISLSLDQSFIQAMEDEARWMIRNNIVNEKVVPDFTKYIYSDGLKTVKP